VNHDRLEQLLHEADAVAGPPPTPPGLPGRVRQRIHKRRRRRRAGAVALAGAAVVIVAALLRPPTPPGEVGGPVAGLPRRPASPPEFPVPARPDGPGNVDLQLAAVRSDLRQLRAESRLRLAAKPRPASSRQILLLSSLGLPDSLAGDRLDEQVESTAGLMIYQADQCYRDLGRPDVAVRSYQRIIELFPETRAAATARARLSGIPRVKERQS
jgi:hypothetical protein